MLGCRDPVYGFAWLQSKTGTECMSAASDGSVLWWDIRKLAEPVETLEVTVRGSERVLGAVSLDYSPQAGPTKFMLGTEQGLVISGNRKAKTPTDRVGTPYTGKPRACPSPNVGGAICQAIHSGRYLISHVPERSSRTWGKKVGKQTVPTRSKPFPFSESAS